MKPPGTKTINTMRIVHIMLLVGIDGVGAFTARSANHRLHGNRRPTSVEMSTQYDVSKPVFDLFSLRSVRGDALTKYDSLNQSEPLRINIWGLLALTFFASPWLSVELNEQSLPVAGVAAAALAGVGSTGLFLRECQRRSRQLNRIEKELNALSLPVRLPSNQLADSAYQKARPLGDLVNKSVKACRLLALSGTSEQLKLALRPLRVLGRRLVQASTYVVIIPTDGSCLEDLGLVRNERYAYLADSGDPEVWRAYFDSISPDNSSSASFRWFGIGATGRSFGSGQGEPPEWLQILGQHLRPTDIIDKPGTSTGDADDVLTQQRVFYEALTEGKLEEMKQVCSTQQASAVSTVIDAGGRLDEWQACLEEGARPIGMRLGDADALVVSATEAYTTIVEFPVAEGLAEATLLAVQHWTRENSSKKWKLALHQTIPWCTERSAGGTLLCDCRGCVALTRRPDRRSAFGGLIS
jgi:hypothetical protein